MSECVCERERECVCVCVCTYGVCMLPAPLPAQLLDQALSDSAVGEELSDSEDTHTAAQVSTNCSSIHVHVSCERQSTQVSQSRSWLLNHLVFPYWNQSNPFHRPLPDSAHHHDTSPHPACGLAEKW